jgi:hypothetical protein
LQYEFDAGSKVRFIDPEKSSIIYTIEDLARENPGIKLSKIVQLLNINTEVAFKIAKKVVDALNVEIDFDI